MAHIPGTLVIRPTAFIRFVFLVVLITVCSCKIHLVDPQPPDESDQTTPPDDKPSAFQLVWSPDEQYLYAIGYQGLQEISVGAGTVTTLDPRKFYASTLSISGTGTYLYWLRNTDTTTYTQSLLRYRRSDGVLDTMLTGIWEYLASPLSDNVVYRDFNSGASILYDPSTGERRSIGNRNVYTFSPDGLDLLTQDPAGDGSIFLVYHSVDSSESVMTFSHKGFIHRFVWNAEALIALCWDYDAEITYTYCYNLTTGSMDTLVSSRGNSSRTFYATGSRVAFWTSRVTDYTTIPLMGRIPTDWDYVVNVYSAVSRSVTQYTIGNCSSADAPGGLAFSPSGTRIACAYRGGVSLLDL